MQDILTAIQATLRGDTDLNYVSDSNILIEVDNAYVPAHAAYPIITLKDGGVERKRDFVGPSSGFMTEETVQINLWQVLLEDDKSIVGSGSTYGVLDIQETVDAILNANTFSLSCVLDVFCDSETQAEIIKLDDLNLVRKTLNYTYLKVEVK